MLVLDLHVLHIITFTTFRRNVYRLESVIRPTADHHEKKRQQVKRYAAFTH